MSLQPGREAKVGRKKSCSLLMEQLVTGVLQSNQISYLTSVLQMFKFSVS